MDFEVPRRRKQLNPELFGETKNQTFIENSSAQTLPHLMQLEQKLGDLKLQMSSVVDHVSKLTTQFTEHVKRSQLKFDQVQTAIQQLQQNDHSLAADTSNRLSQIHNRMGERNMFEEKVQELIDRQNQVLKTFEMKMLAMQKLLAEKENQYMQAQGALNECKMEISRLKRI